LENHICCGQRFSPLKDSLSRKRYCEKRAMISRQSFRNRIAHMPVVYRTALALVTVATALMSCTEERVNINIDNYIVFLKAAPEQEPDIRRQLEKARGIFSAYYAKLDSVKALRNTIPADRLKDELFKEKTAMASELYTVIRSVQELLDDDQRAIFARSELYHFFDEMRLDIMNDSRAADRIPYERRVSPGVQQPGGKGAAGSALRDWTVYFGQSVHPLLGNAQGSLSRSARRLFPIGVQATLMNNYPAGNMQAFNEPDAVNPDRRRTTDINVIVFSRIHESFTDINRWVVFLELSDNTQIEPVKVIPLTKEWFDENNLLPSSRLPSFFMPADAARERTGGEMGGYRNRRFPGISGQELYRSYYRLVFTYAINGTPLIYPGNDFLRLVFLEKVGSSESAHGIWYLDWQGVASR